MKRAAVIWLVLVVAAAMFGCGPTGKLPAPLAGPVSTSPAALNGAAAVNAFGFDLMRTSMAASTSTSNVVLSPLSVHAALSMTLLGAKGKTAAQMQRTLHLTGDNDASTSTYSMLLDALAHRSKEQTLTIANSIWVDSHLAVKRDFLNANRISFGSAVKTLDFSSNDMVGNVNGWVADNTHQMIQHIINQLDPKTVMLLANAVYFKATWSEPFVTELTQPQAFHLSSAQTTDVPMMRDTRMLPVVQTASYSATKLAYRGGDTEAYLILPANGRSVESVLGKMSAAKFASLRKRLDSEAPTRTALALPKFDTAVGGSIADALKRMGMPTAFDSRTADFRAMATPPPGQNIWIGDVIHKARIKVDEQGTEAAAATLVEMVSGAAAAPVRLAPPVPFVCDRPFAMAIVDTRTGALLFLAAINNPKLR